MHIYVNGIELLVMDQNLMCSHTQGEELYEQEYRSRVSHGPLTGHGLHQRYQ